MTHFSLTFSKVNVTIGKKWGFIKQFYFQKPLYHKLLRHDVLKACLKSKKAPNKFLWYVHVYKKNCNKTFWEESVEKSFLKPGPPSQKNSNYSTQSSTRILGRKVHALEIKIQIWGEVLTWGKLVTVEPNWHYY